MNISDSDWHSKLLLARKHDDTVDSAIFDACRSAAASGDKKAQAELSLMLYGGEGTSMDHPEAFNWLNKAADDPIQLNMTYKLGREYNLPSAYFGLFVMWWMGIGVPEDEAMSNKNLKLAAEHGYAAAMDEIGGRHHIGLYGFDFDETEAEKWFLKAIENGYAFSHGRLSSIYKERGDLEKAFYHLKNVCQIDGYSVYYKDLAVMHREGLGTETDNMKAFKWFYVAAVQTEFYNQDILNLKDEMTQENVNKAIEDAKTWLSINEEKLPRFMREFDVPTCL